MGDRVKVGVSLIVVDSDGVQLFRTSLESWNAWDFDSQRELGKAIAEGLPEGAFRPSKGFDLNPGDHIRVTMPAQYPFPAGWAEGVVIEAHWYSDAGWYIEFEKESVSPGWQTGYGYWKQREDGGTVEKMY